MHLYSGPRPLELCLYREIIQTLQKPLCFPKKYECWLWIAYAIYTCSTVIDTFIKKQVLKETTDRKQYNFPSPVVELSTLGCKRTQTSDRESKRDLLFILVQT